MNINYYLKCIKDKIADKLPSWKYRQFIYKYFFFSDYVFGKKRNKIQKDFYNNLNWSLYVIYGILLSMSIFAFFAVFVDFSNKHMVITLVSLFMGGLLSLVISKFILDTYPDKSGDRCLENPMGTRNFLQAMLKLENKNILRKTFFGVLTIVLIMVDVVLANTISTSFILIWIVAFAFYQPETIQKSQKNLGNHIFKIVSYSALVILFVLIIFKSIFSTITVEFFVSLFNIFLLCLLWIYETNNKLKDRRAAKKEAKIMPLSPSENIDIEIYDKFLYKVLYLEKNIKNIAITGGFGIGKSSAIASFERRHNKKFMHISLAEFTEKTKDREHSVEYDILKQILAKSRTKKITQSVFKAIPDKISFFDYVWLFFAIVIPILYLTFNNSMSETIIKMVYKLDFAPFIAIVNHMNIAVFIYCLIIGSISFVKIFKMVNFGKIRIKNDVLELDIDKGSDINYLDKHLFDIVYILEQIRRDVDHVIVFEDMDRLNPNNTIELFTKLRNINNIVNSRLYDNHKKSLKFIYMFDENIFAPRQRNKFFDYILPIVPNLSIVNVKQQLKDFYFKDLGITFKDNYSESFLSLVSEQLNEYRQIYSIMNDYNLYYQIMIKRNMMERTSDNNQKIHLLAYLIYKNIYPKDCSLFGTNEGVLFKHCKNISLSNKENEDSFRMRLLKYIDADTMGYMGKSLVDSLSEKYNISLNTGDFSELNAYIDRTSPMNSNFFKRDVNNLNFEFLLNVMSPEDFKKWGLFSNQLFYYYVYCPIVMATKKNRCDKSNFRYNEVYARAEYCLYMTFDEKDYYEDIQSNFIKFIDFMYYIKSNQITSIEERLTFLKRAMLILERFFDRVFQNRFSLSIRKNGDEYVLDEIEFIAYMHFERHGKRNPNDVKTFFSILKQSPDLIDANNLIY